MVYSIQIYRQTRVFLTRKYSDKFSKDQPFGNRILKLLRLSSKISRKQNILYKLTKSNNNCIEVSVFYSRKQFQNLFNKSFPFHKLLIAKDKISLSFLKFSTYRISLFFNTPVRTCVPSMWKYWCFYLPWFFSRSFNFPYLLCTNSNFNITDFYLYLPTYV